MLNKRFLIGWPICAVVMFSASYVWHGVILNDYDRLNYPKSFYLTIAAFVYLFLGALVTRAYSSEIIKKITSAPLAKGLLSGAICGVVIYLIALVIGISFSSTISMKYIIVDLTWQAIEQSIGGLVVGYYYIVTHHHPAFNPEFED